MKLIKELKEAMSNESTARKIASQLVQAARNQNPSNDKKALAAAQQAAKALAVQIQKEIIAYDKESTFIQ